MTDENNAQAEGPAATDSVAPESNADTTQKTSENDQSDAGADKSKTIDRKEDSKRQSRLDRRIGELTYRSRQFERENQELRARLESFEKRNTQQSPQKPNSDDYKTHEEYIEALSEWKFEQKFEERLKKKQEVDSQENQKRQIEETRQKWESKEASFSEKTPDYDDVIQDLIIPKSPTGKAVSEALLNHEKGPEVVYHLAKNPDLQDDIFGSIPERAVIKLNKFAASLGAKPQPSQQKSNLPDPPTSLKGGGSIKSEDQMSGKELLKKYGV